MANTHQVEHSLARGSLHRLHEKGCKLEFILLEVREIGIVLPYGLKVGPGLDPKFAIIFSKDGTLPSGYRSLNASGDASQSFPIRSPHFFFVVAGEGLIGALILPKR